MSLGEEQRANLEAELGTLAPGWTLSQFADLGSLLPEDQALEIASLRALGKLSWTREESTLERVLEILSALAAIASPITVVAGGITGLAGAVTALRGL